jgi:hypothetical protein
MPAGSKTARSPVDVEFTMLRFSFRRDVKPDEIGPAIQDISKLWRDLRARTQSEISGDRAAFTAIVAGLGDKTSW